MPNDKSENPVEETPIIKKEEKEVKETVAMNNAEMFVTKERYEKDMAELKENVNSGFTNMNTFIESNKPKETPTEETEENEPYI